MPQQRVPPSIGRQKQQKSVGGTGSDQGGKAAVGCGKGAEGAPGVTITAAMIGGAEGNRAEQAHGQLGSPNASPHVHLNQAVCDVRCS